MTQRIPCDECNFPTSNLVTFSDGADAYLCGGCLGDSRAAGHKASIVAFPSRIDHSREAARARKTA